MVKILAFMLSLALIGPAFGQSHDAAVIDLLDQLRVLHTTGPDPVPDPVGGVPAAIVAMVPGTWLAYGAPWEDVAPAERLCNNSFGAVLGAWNGWARDGLRYIYVAASGGHADGCDNGVYRYDIQAGKAELVVPHVELNAGLETTRPFVADADGVQILPRSSHTGNGQYYEEPWLYLVTGSVYKDGGADGQVWRYHVIEKRWERLPDRRSADGSILGKMPIMVKTPNGPVLMGAWMICDVDLVAGQYDCQNKFYFSSISGVAYDPERQGIWYINSKFQSVRFLRRIDGIWQQDDSLSGVFPDDINIDGNPGVCVVPGQGILIWSSSADLHHWDGVDWSIINTPGGPLVTEKRKVENKWSWNDEAQVCIGGWTTNEGLWVYKPGQIGDNPSPPPDPEPDPEPVPVEDVDLEAKWSIDRNNLPSIGGVAVQVAAWQPAPWDQPIERLLGAPDYNAICAGEWVELHYRTNDNLAGSKWETERLARAGTPNVRIYLHPLKNAAGDVVAYTEGIKGRSQCLEVIGVPDNERKPQLKANISLDNGRGLIVRGLLLAEGGGECIHAKGSKAQLSQPAFVVIHDSEFYACAGHVHFFGVASSKYPPTYLEMIGNVSAYSKSHAQYNERSVGRFVYKSNICFAGGWGHCLKNLAHSSLIEGNVFSNAGLNGQVITAPSSPIIGERTYTGGMHPLDLYACTQTVVRGNTFVYRTTSNIRNVIAYRGRGAWGECNKGRRLAEDRWEYLPPTDPAYQDTTFWAAVREAIPLFDEGFDAARTSDMLFAHKANDNRFIVLLAWKPGRINIDRVSAANVRSLRPTNKFAIRDTLSVEASALLEACSKDAACFYEEASEELRYAYDHSPADWQRTMVERSKLPSSVPILAPPNWAERYALYWGPQEGWACDAEGATCVPWDVPVPRVPVEDWGHDPVKQASPPRVIVEGG